MLRSLLEQHEQASTKDPAVVKDMEVSTPETFAEIIGRAAEFIATEVKTAMGQVKAKAGTDAMPKANDDSSPETPKKSFLSSSSGRYSPGRAISTEMSEFFDGLLTMVDHVKTKLVAANFDRQVVEDVGKLTLKFLDHIRSGLRNSLAHMGQKSSTSFHRGVSFDSDIEFDLDRGEGALLVVFLKRVSKTLEGISPNNPSSAEKSEDKEQPKEVEDEDCLFGYLESDEVENKPSEEESKDAVNEIRQHEFLQKLQAIFIGLEEDLAQVIADFIPILNDSAAEQGNTKDSGVGFAQIYCNGIIRAVNVTLTEVDRTDLRSDIKAEIAETISDNRALHLIIGFAVDLMDAAFPVVNTLDKGYEAGIAIPASLGFSRRRTSPRDQGFSGDFYGGMFPRSEPLTAAIPIQATGSRRGRSRSEKALSPQNGYTTSGPKPIGSRNSFAGQRNTIFDSGTPIPGSASSKPMLATRQVPCDSVFGMSFAPDNGFASFKPGGGKLGGS